MTGPVTTEALVEALAHELARLDGWQDPNALWTDNLGIIARGGEGSPVYLDYAEDARALVAGPLAPLLAENQQVTAERVEARALIRHSLKVGAPGLSETAREAVLRSIMLKLEGKVLAPLLADLQRVTAERDEARKPFGNSTPTVQRITLLMGQVWLEAKGAAGDTIADFEEFAILAPEDCAACHAVAKAVLAAIDPAKANDRAAQLQAEVEALKGALHQVKAWIDTDLPAGTSRAGIVHRVITDALNHTALAARAATAREGA